jgi:hypothetical protein
MPAKKIGGKGRSPVKDVCDRHTLQKRSGSQAPPIRRSLALAFTQSSSLLSLPQIPSDDAKPDMLDDGL